MEKFRNACGGGEMPEGYEAIGHSFQVEAERENIFYFVAGTDMYGIACNGENVPDDEAVRIKATITPTPEGRHIVIVSKPGSKIPPIFEQ